MKTLSAILLFSIASLSAQVAGVSQGTTAQRATVQNAGLQAVANGTTGGNRYLAIDANTGQVLGGSNSPNQTTWGNTGSLIDSLGNTGMRAVGGGMGTANSIQNGDYLGAASQGIGVVQNLLDSGTGQKIMGSLGNMMNGTLGQGAGSAASGAGGAAGGASGASGGGGGGAGAAVMDIGNILQSVLQLMQLTSQTGILNNQLSTLGKTLEVNSQDLAVTRAINGNIGQAQDFSQNNGGLMNSLGSGVGGILGGSGGTVGTGGSSAGTTSGMSSIMQAGSQVGGFLSDKAGSLFDLFAGAKNIIGAASNFSNDPLGSSLDILNMLFGGSPANRLASMSAEEMMMAGADVPGAMASSFNNGILANSGSAVAANTARLERIAKLNQAAASSQSLNETAAVQTQVGIEGLRNQNEQIAQQATQVSAIAANAERAAQLEMLRRRQNNAALLIGR